MKEREPSIRPRMEDIELEELADRMKELMEEGSEILLQVWGWFDEPVIGKISKMDVSTKLVHVQKNGETTRVPFKDIMKVDMI